MARSRWWNRFGKRRNKDQNLLKPRPRRRARPYLERLEDRLAPALIKWGGGPTGLGTDWNNPANWVGNVLPTAADDVQIDSQFAGITITFATQNSTIRSLTSAASLSIVGGTFAIVDTGSAPASQVNNTFTIVNSTVDFSASLGVKNLNFTSGLLTGSGTVTVTNSATWAGGTMQGSGVIHIPAGATLTISGDQGETFHESRQLTNDGTVKLTGAGPVTSQVDVNDRVRLTNNGLLEIVSNANVVGGGTLLNTGTVRKDATNNATSDIDWSVSNSGTVDILGGTLRLGGAGGGNPAVMSSGAFGLAASTGLEFATDGQTLTATSKITGAGNVTFSNGPVTINGSYTISGLTAIKGGVANFNTDVSLPGLQLSVGTLAGTGTVTLTGTTNWTGGNMAGPGTTHIAAGAELILSSPGVKGLNNGRQLVNDGTISVEDTGSLVRSGGDLPMLTNNGLFEIKADASVINSGTFLNNGTLRKDAGTTGTSEIDFAFTNSGTVDVLGGTLSLRGGDAPAGASTGAFQVAPNTGLEFAPQSPLTLAASSKVSGAGHVTFGNGPVTINGSYAVTGLTLIGGGGLDFPGGGTAVFNSNISIPTLEMHGSIFGRNPANLAGTGTVTVTNTLKWTGGTMTGTGTTHIAAGAEAILSGSDFKGLLSPRQLVNDGTINLEDTGSLGSTGGNPTLVNNGLFEIKADASVIDSGNFLNNGTLRKDAGSTGTSGFEFGLSNSGKVEVLGGTLSLRGAGGTQLAFTSTGAFQVADGATLDFAPQDQTLAASSSVTGAGNVTFSNGRVTINGTYTMTGLTTIGNSGPVVNFNSDVSLPKLQFNNGILAGSGTLTLTGSATWTGGSMTGSGATHIAAGAALDIGGAAEKALGGSQRLVNDGILTLTGAGDLSQQSVGTLTNNDLFELRDGARGVTGPGPFLNSGTLRKDAGTGTSEIGNLNNSGTLEVLGGTLAVRGSLSNYSEATRTLTGGTFVLRNSTFQFTNALIQTNAAAIVLDGPAVQIIDQSNTDALARLAANAAAGSFTIQNGRNFTAAGSFNNAGSLTIGASSTFTAGSYTEAGTGSLTIGIGGSPASGQFGTLTTTGSATLGGALTVSLVNGFGPSTGQSFRVLSFASHSGIFATVNGLRVRGVPVFDVAVNPADVTVTTKVSVADLAADTLTIPATAVPGENVAIQYSVHNQSAAVPATGSWFDSLYLSVDTTLDDGDLLIGRIQHTGDVAPLGNYSGTLTAPLPGTLEGPYHVILVVDSRGLVPDVNRTNNTLASPDVLQAGLQNLTVGQKVSGTIAAGQDHYFRLDVPAGSGDVQITTNLAGAEQGQLFVRRGALPDRTNFDQAADTFAIRQQTLVLSQPGGTYYILVHGLPSAAGGQPFDLIAEQGVFDVRAMLPAQGSNAGSVTVQIFGAGFSPATVVGLASNNVNRPAKSVAFKDGLPLFATFDLTGLAPGQYEVRLQDGSRQTTVPVPFTVTTGNPGRLDAFVNAPAKLLAFTSGTMGVAYVNVGDTDLPVGPLELKADGATLSLVNPEDQGRTRQLSASTLDFLTTQIHGLAGVLPPGVRDGISVNFQPPPPDPRAAPPVVQFFVSSPQQSPLDLTALKNALRPASIPADAWDVIFANFATQIGNTVQSLQAALDDAGTYLSQISQATDDDNLLLAFLLQQADNAYPGGALAADIDAAAPVPGLPLSLSRIYLQPISRRFQLGEFGRGWETPYDITLQADASGQFLVQGPTGTRYFLPDGGTSLQAHGLFGDPGILVGAQTDPFGHLTGPATLHETDGTEYRFEADGKLHEIRDSNGNTITLNYSDTTLHITDSRLTSLVHSDGDSFQLEYNAQGRVSKLTDQAKRVTTYTYDAAGEHLLQVSSPFGTVSYTYEAGTGAAQEHALQSITHPDGSHTFYTYDTQGRLVRTAQESSPGVTFSYGQGGTVTLTDATSASVTVLFNAFGQPSLVRDSLGRLVPHDYDSNQNPLQDRLPGNLAVNYQFNNQALPTSLTDAAGHGIAQTFAASQVLTLADGSQLPTTQRQTDLTDQLGAVTHFAYDPQGNLLTVTYADGSTEQYAHDAAGNVKQYRNRAGQLLRFSYNARGQLLRRNHTDGSHEDFTYDDRGNLLTATDAHGTTMYQYNAADLLTRVVYPNGRFLEYSYDAGRRLIRLADQDGFAVNYAYDAAGRLTRLADGAASVLVTYFYDAAGRLAREEHGNGTVTSYEYDAAGELLHLVNRAPGGAVNSRFDYTYDDLGRRTGMTTLDGQWTYESDALGQLTHAVFASTNPAVPNQDLRYEYDAAGNRVRTVVNGKVTGYTANDLDQYTQVGTAKYGYDPDGNLIESVDGPNASTYTYEDQGRLVHVTTPDGTWSYEYDALGNRVATVHNGQRTEYLLDPTGLGSVVGEYDGTGGLVARYAHGLGLEARVGANGQSAFYDFDGTGSTAGVSGSDGRYVDTYSYLPFGEPLAAPHETVPNPFRYVGQFGVMQEGNGLDLMRARFYSLTDGRFVSQDPIRTLGGLNLYRYAGNQPTSFIDPSGLIKLEDIEFEEIVDDVNADEFFEAVDTINELNPFTAGTAEAPSEGATEEVVVQRGAVSVKPDGKAVPLLKFLQGLKNPKGFIPLGTSLLVGLVSGVLVAAENYLGKNFGQKINKSHPELGETAGSYYGDRLADKVFGKNRGLEASGSTRVVFSLDPNDLIGPAGSGDNHFIAREQSLDYTVHFENLATATAPAQKVVVTQQLDPGLDFTTFELGDFGFGNTLIHVPAGRSSYQTRIDARSTLGVFVDVTADINPETGLANWTFTSEDPQTFDLPEDPLVGFLPPNQTAPEGEGFVSYHVRPRSADSTGTRLDAKAQVVFDANAPLDTPASFNTVDAGDPTSSVTALPAVTRGTSFTVNWSGQDDPGGSGIAFFDVFVSDNGGAFTPLLQSTTQTSTTFTGQVGHTYGFFSVATDNVGHREATPAGAQATTTVAAAQTATTTVVTSDHASGSVYGQAVTFTAAVSAAGGGTSSPTGSVQFQIDGSSFGSPVTLSSGTAALTVSSLTARSHSVSAIYTSDSGAFGNSQTSSPFSQSVAPATLTVTAKNASRVFGAANPTLTAAITGFVNNDTASVVSGNASLSTTATTSSGVGAYPITAAQGSLSAANYRFVFQSGTLTVSPANVSGTIQSSQPVSVVGQPVTYIVSLNVVPPGAGVPGGSVSFTVDGITQAPAVAVDTHGKAAFTLTSLAAGTHTIAATYSGNGNFNAATLPAIAQTVNTSLTGNQLLVDDLFHAILGRAPDTEGLRAFTGLLDRGVSRWSVALALETSLEARMNQVESLYHAYLGRAAEPSGLAAATSLLMNGWTETGLQAAILGSQEYFLRHGGTNPSFLASLYRDVLGRPIDAGGLASGTSMLQQGQSRTAVAMAVVTSPEGRADEAEALFRQFLHRDAEPAALAAVVAAFLHGATDEGLAAQIAASDEFFARL
jgi:RHS repeat-associated protein